MFIKRLTASATSFLLSSLCVLLLLLGVQVPVAARAPRAKKTHHTAKNTHHTTGNNTYTDKKGFVRHHHERVFIPKMLPTVIPASREGYVTVLRGRSSWYGAYFQGMETSSGEKYDRFQYTCAHKTLPFNTRLRVTNTKNGVSVVVRVTDRGPFRKDRIIDLSEIAARPMGLIESGYATVVAEIMPADTPLGPTETPTHLAQLVNADPHPQAQLVAYQLPQKELASPLPLVAALEPVAALLVQPAATEGRSCFEVATNQFTDLQKALTFQARVQSIDDKLQVSIKTEEVDGLPVQRVLIGQIDNWLAAETVRRNLQMWGIAGLVRKTNAIEPQPTTNERLAYHAVIASSD